MARSTCILRFAILRVMVNSLCVNRSLVFIGGMFKATLFNSSKSAMVNPQSAMIESPGSNRDRMPHRSDLICYLHTV